MQHHRFRLWQVGQARKLFVSVWSRSQSFLFCNYLFFQLPNPKDLADLENRIKPMDSALIALFAIANVVHSAFHVQLGFPMFLFCSD